MREVELVWNGKSREGCIPDLSNQSLHMKINKKTIAGKPFRLFYDYDKNNLRNLSLDGKIEWFQKRLEMNFIQPMNKIFQKNSIVWNELEKSDDPKSPCAFMLIAVSILLNGIEALGAFLRFKSKNIKGENKRNFREFFERYLKNWTINASTHPNPKGIKDLVEILWLYYRNSLAHGFRIQYGGIDFKKDCNDLFFYDEKKIFQINYPILFRDFLNAVDVYFRDLKNPSEVTLRQLFETRFKEFYP